MRCGAPHAVERLAVRATLRLPPSPAAARLPSLALAAFASSPLSPSSPSAAIAGAGCHPQPPPTSYPRRLPSPAALRTLPPHPLLWRGGLAVWANPLLVVASPPRGLMSPCAAWRLLRCLEMK